jgi:hypothetical protein
VILCVARRTSRDARRTTHVQETLVLLVESALRRAQNLTSAGAR